MTTPAYCNTPPNETSMTLSEQQQSQLNKISESSSTAGSVIRNPSLTSSKAVTISSLVSQHIILPSSASHSTSSGSLTALRNCVIDMSIPTTNGQPFAGLTIKNIKSCLLVCGSVGGATHVTNVEGSVLVVTTRQFRMHDSKDCVVYLHCSSRPIIEECTDIRFTPIPETYVRNCRAPWFTNRANPPSVTRGFLLALDTIAKSVGPSRRFQMAQSRTQPELENLGARPSCSQRGVERSCTRWPGFLS